MASLDRSAAALARRFDVLVVGAGITGVQIAREVAARGRSVLVVDKGDYGSGTSSATTKYLHGGIRYLEQGDVGVVRESLRERRTLSLAAPHLVRPTRFLLPVWRWSRPGPATLSAGAAVYEALALGRNRGAPSGLRIGRATWLGPGAARRAVPWLEPDELRGAVVVSDVMNVHPERLLLALLLDAVSLGAVARNHTRVQRFVTTPTSGGSVRVVGAELVDGIDGSCYRVLADRVVNAAGPWIGDVLDLLDRRVGPSVMPSKGVHVLTAPARDGVRDAVLARTRNGRHVVVSPWQGRTLIGPTDTPVNASMDDVHADASDVDELLAIANSCRRRQDRLDVDDVADVTVGVRPLVVEPGGDTYSASRRHAVYDHAADGVGQLWTVAGGKWTTGRAVAADVADRVLGPAASRTPTRPVAGAAWAVDPATLLELPARLRPDMSLPREVAEHLGRLFGTRAAAVLELIAEDPRLGARVSTRAGIHDVLAQVVLAVRDEGAVTLGDIVDRRLALGTLGPVEEDELQRVAAVAAPLLGWTDAGTAEAAAELARRRQRREQWHRRT